MPKSDEGCSSTGEDCSITKQASLAGEEVQVLPGTGRALVPMPAAGVAHHPAGLPGSPHHKARSPLPAQIPASELKGQRSSAPTEDAFHLTHEELG